LWTVRTRDFSTWTHFYEAAQFWARCFTRTADIEPRATCDLVAHNCFLPLAAARWLNVVSGTRSGPVGLGLDDAYLNAAPTEALRRRFAADLERFITHQLASLQHTSGESQAHV